MIETQQDPEEISVTLIASPSGAFKLYTLAEELGALPSEPSSVLSDPTRLHSGSLESFVPAAAAITVLLKLGTQAIDFILKADELARRLEEPITIAKDQDSGRVGNLGLPKPLTKEDAQTILDHIDVKV